MPKPQSTPTPNIRTKARGNTIAPFPINLQPLSRFKKVIWLKTKNPKKKLSLSKKSPFKKIAQRKVILRKIQKASTNPLSYVEQNFKNIKNQIESDIDSLFHFIDDEFPAKADLIKEFNKQIKSGKISTIAQMKNLYKKAEQLANCLNLYLEKNDYCENFAKEITIQVFEHGFSKKKQADFIKKYPNYFSDTAPKTANRRLDR